ncbi:MAG: hypothetical protein AAF907_01890, partial [Planctomycetota bacterium]
MNSAKHAVVSSRLHSLGRLLRRPALASLALASSGAVVGCETTGGRLMSFWDRPGDPAAIESAEDPFGAAERAMAASGQKPYGLASEGLVNLGGPVRTVDAGGARTAARVTRVDPMTPPRAVAGRWKAGAGDDDAGVIRT